jgi:signal transduction histidine kinase
LFQTNNTDYVFNIVQYPDSYTGELFSYYTDESTQVIGIITAILGLIYIHKSYISIFLISLILLNLKILENNLDLKKLILLFLLSFVFYACHKNKEVAEPSNYATIDSLISKSNDATIDRKFRLNFANQVNALLDHDVNDSITNNYLLKLAGRYYNIGALEQYVALSREVYKKTLESNNYLLNAKSLSYIGDYHYDKFDNDSAYFYYSKAEKTYLKLKDKANIDRLKFYKAYILFAEKDFLGCEIATVSILKSMYNKEDQRLIYDCYMLLGDALGGLNNTRTALEYYDKASQLLLKLKNDPQYLSLEGQTSNYIGRVYQKQNNYNKAIEYFKKGLQFDDYKKSMPFLYANLTNNLGYSKFKVGDKSAIQLLDKSLVIRDSLQDIPGIVSSKINLSEYYLAQKDTARALFYSTEAKTMAHKNKIFEDELKALKLLADIDPKKEQSYNKRYIKLTDSLQNNERAVRNKFARIEFETDEIITEKNTIEAEKNKISVQRWVILGFSLIGILVLGLLYLTKMQHAKNKELQYEKQQQIANEEIYQLMLDQQSNIDEGRKKEKKRISQELHDGVMSRLTSTRLNLFILSKKTDQATIQKCLVHIADIQNIEKEIRSISHDLAQDKFIGKDSFKIIIESLFESQKSISTTAFALSIDESINWEVVESATKMHIYRICQEALQNIHKYANAKNCEITFANQDNQLQIKIKDNGAGFDSEKSASGIGIKNMNSRVQSINGKINIESKIGEGTLLNLLIPI